MKRFLKSMVITLLIGIPLILLAGGILYLKTDRFVQNPVPDHPVTLEQTIHSDSDEVISEIENVSENKNESATLSFAGDVHFSEQYIEKYDKEGISCLADEEMLNLMNDADLFVLNNEFAFSSRGEAMEDKQYTLRNDPKYVKILQELGTDLVGIANNHVLDFGQEAFSDTLNTLRNADIDYVGGGNNISEALEPAVYTMGNQTFAIFAATRVSPSASWYASKSQPGVLQTYDPKTLNEAILAADDQYDHIIVYVHWGIERSIYPEEYQRTLAKGYIDAGADLIIGAHPHVLQGFEYYKGVPICYSLGNYLFGNRTGETLLLNANFDKNGDLTLQLIPCERVNGVLSRIEDPVKLFNQLTDISYNGTAVSHGGVVLP